MIRVMDYRLDGCIRATTTKGNIGTYQGRNEFEIFGYTKTFGEVRFERGGIPIGIVDNSEKWRKKINSMIVNADFVIEVKHD